MFAETCLVKLIFLILQIQPIPAEETFEVIHSWNYLNFTWPSQRAYHAAYASQRYSPKNNGFSGIKIYNNTIYLSLPRTGPGSPVTLASLSIGSVTENPLLDPYPSWEANVQKSCSTLQNVQSMEIDTKGIMWVLDTNRYVSGITNCPPKIVLLDINNNGKVIQVYHPPNEISPHQGGWINDLVVDESDGGYAYMSEASNADPGIVVYSRRQNKAWKLRDRSVFAEPQAEGYKVHGIALNKLFNINGVALDPVEKSKTDRRLFYYGILTGYGLYALDVNILKNKTIAQTSEWRKEVIYVGTRSGNTDGLGIDNKGNLYYGLLDKNAIAKWNVYNEPFANNTEVIYQNNTTVDWPDSYGFGYGYLYVTSDESERILNTTTKHPPPEDGIRFRILRSYTKTLSYMFPLNATIKSLSC